MHQHDSHAGMDAVQQANSGHPGTPMAMAPVAYTLWQQFLRFDPSDPIWPNRDRFVLSTGHASMLLYSMLHLTRVERSTPTTRCSGSRRSRSTTSSTSASSTASARGIPSTAGPAGVETTTGPLGQGVGDERRHGHRRRSGSRRTYNRPGFDAVRLQRLRALRRRLHDGGHRARGGVARRAPEARRTSAGSTTTTASRSRGTPRSPSPRTSPRASSATAGTSRRVGDANDLDAAGRARSTTFRDDHGPADADHRRQPHRLRRAGQAGHQRGPRRAARRRGDHAHQAQLRLARGREVPRARRRATSTSRDGIGPARREAARRLGGAVRATTRRQYPELADELDRMQRRRAAGRLGRGHPDVPRRRRRAWPAATRRARC